jgi:hypothetical protein
MFLDASASSSPSKSPMHYAHTDGGVSAIRCLDQSVDEPPDSPAPPAAGPQRDFLTSVCEHCEIPGWFAPDVHIELISDLLSLTTLGNVRLVVS